MDKEDYYQDGEENIMVKNFRMIPSNRFKREKNMTFYTFIKQ
jgi:hypothetical protein